MDRKMSGNGTSWHDAVAIGLASFFIAIISNEFAIRLIHTSTSTASWGDAVETTPTDSLLAVLAISAVFYSLLIMVQKQSGRLGSAAGWCLITGSVGVVNWAFDKSNEVLTSNVYVTGGVILVVAGVVFSGLSILNTRQQEDAFQAR